MNKNTVGAAARDLRQSMCVGIEYMIMSCENDFRPSIRAFEDGCPKLTDDHIKIVADAYIKTAEQRVELIQRKVELLKEVAGL